MKDATKKNLGRAWMGLISLHLLIVALGAFNVHIFDLRGIGRALEFYGGFSGAGDSYGFFAPGIEGQSRILFDVTTRSGEIKEVPFHTSENHEADIRLGNIVDQFSLDDGEEPTEIHRSMVASLAATMFGRFDDAVRVTVKLEHLEPVTIEEYRNGLRQEWYPFYSATFERKTPKRAITR